LVHVTIAEVFGNRRQRRREGGVAPVSSRSRTSEALEAITEAEALVERSEERWWCAELHRLRGVFLTAIRADETQIEASFRQAISTAKEQKSISLAKRAEASNADYRRQKGKR